MKSPLVFYYAVSGNAGRNNFGAADVKQAMEVSDGMRCNPFSAEFSIGVSGNFPVEAGFGCFSPLHPGWNACGGSLRRNNGNWPFLQRAQMGSRIAVAVQTPLHAGIAWSPDAFHARHVSMAGRAADAPVQVGHVVKIGVTGQAVDHHPADRFSCVTGVLRVRRLPQGAMSGLSGRICWWQPRQDFVSGMPALDERCAALWQAVQFIFRSPA